MDLQFIHDALGRLSEQQYGADWLPIDRLHAVAMVAKECVFKAQDELHRVYKHGEPMASASNRLAAKVDKALAKIRADLEALDRDIRNA